jgi:hypothetical protein
LTLVEVLVAAALLSLVLAGLHGLLQVTARGLAGSDPEADAVLEFERTVERLRRDLRSARALPGGPAPSVEEDGRVLRLTRWHAEDGAESAVTWRFEPGEPIGVLSRTEAAAGATAPEPLRPARFSGVRFSLYSLRLQAPQLVYRTPSHPDYSPLFLRVELSGLSGRELVTSVALQPATRKQLDRHWNPVR